MNPSLFLSHSHRDKHFVRRLANDLTSAGARVWFDEAEIKIGDSLLKRIEEGICGADYLGAVLSPDSVNSNWVQRELEIALTEEIAGRIVKVLPLLFRDCEIPKFLAGKLYADFRVGRDYKSTLSRLLDRLGLKMPSDAQLEANYRTLGYRLHIVPLKSRRPTFDTMGAAVHVPLPVYLRSEGSIVFAELYDFPSLYADGDSDESAVNQLLLLMDGYYRDIKHANCALSEELAALGDLLWRVFQEPKETSI